MPLLPLVFQGLPHAPMSRSQGTEARAPNVVMIVLDDVGVEQLGFYGIPAAWGETHARTPVLDHIRAQGVLFERTWASPMCSPSRAMLLTGRHGFRTGMLSLSETIGPCPPGTTSAGVNGCCPVGDPQCAQSAPSSPLHPTGYSLPASEITLAEALRDATYASPVHYARGAFGKWHVAGKPDDPCHPIEQGFEVFQGHLYNNEHGGFHFYDWIRVDASESIGACVSSSSSVVGAWTAEVTAADARQWIDGVTAQQPDRPFFAYVAFNPPHRPFQVPPQALVSSQTWDELQLAGLAHEGLQVEGVRSCQAGTNQEVDSRAARLVYRAMLEAVDRLIGHVVLRGPGQPELLENTVVFVVGDNGTPDQIYPATQDPSAVGVNGPPFAPNHAKFQTYELGVRVPLLVAGKGVAVGGHCTALISAVDLWSTILQLAGADATGLVPADEIDSRSFAPRLRRPVGPVAGGDRTTIYAEFASRNGLTYSRATHTWSPVGPGSPGVKYERAVLEDSGYKFIRRVVNFDPGCSTAARCAALPREEIFRLFSGPAWIDAFEGTPLCGDPAADAELLTLRGVLSSRYAGD